HTVSQRSASPDPRLAVRTAGGQPVDPRVVLPVAERGEGGPGAAGVARPRGERGEVGAPVANVADQDDDVGGGALAREPLERGRRRPGYPVVQVDIRDTGDPQVLEVGPEAGHHEVVAGDLDGGRLGGEAVPEGGGAEQTGGAEQELAAGER